MVLLSVVLYVWRSPGDEGGVFFRVVAGATAIALFAKTNPAAAPYPRLSQGVALAGGAIVFLGSLDLSPPFFAALACAAAYLATFAPTWWSLVIIVPLALLSARTFYSYGYGDVAEVIHPDPRAIRAIVFEPGEIRERQLPLVGHSVRDARFIAEVTRALDASRPFSPRHPNAKWSTLVGLDYGDHVAYFEVYDTANNGTLISVSSDRLRGRVLCDRRSDELGAILSMTATTSAFVERRSDPASTEATEPAPR